VLAIAMCRAGVGRCHAFDIDANAISEARKNVALNSLSSRIQVAGTPLPLHPGRYGFLCANLRVPTLKQISGLIRQNLIPGSPVVLSGIRQWEETALIDHYKDQGFSLVWRRDEKQWSGLIMTAAK
jgi:ribosomal protein L11 methyltransferase